MLGPFECDVGPIECDVGPIECDVGSIECDVEPIMHCRVSRPSYCVKVFVECVSCFICCCCIVIVL